MRYTIKSLIIFYILTLVLITYLAIFKVISLQNSIFVLFFLLTILILNFVKMDLTWFYVSLFLMFVTINSKLNLLFEITAFLTILGQFIKFLNPKRKYIYFFILIVLSLTFSRFVSNSFMLNNYYLPLIYNFK